MSYEPSVSPAVAKTNVPGILLIVTGVLNVLGALFVGYEGVSLLAFKDQVQQEFHKGFQQEIGKQNRTAQERQQAEQVAGIMDKFLSIGAWPLIILGLLGIVAGLLTLFAGIKMRSLQSYGLSVFGAILPIIPGISPSCCCVLGAVAGIWSLVVLLSADVKAAFTS